MSSTPKPVTIATLQRMKESGRKIAMLTAYDFPMARILDQAGVDILLVGDSLAMVIQGRATTLPVRLRDMIYHGELVVRAVQRALVVVDLPFPHGQLGVRETLKVAAKIMKRTGCQAVKLEGGSEQSETISVLVGAGIPVMAHVGLRPQSVHALGGYKVQRNAERIKQDALAAEQAGAFSVLMECVPRDVAREVSRLLKVPTIGIGAGADCDGQVVVTYDMIGLTRGYVPKFVRPLADIGNQISASVKTYIEQVQDGSFPGDEESFS